MNINPNTHHHCHHCGHHCDGNCCCCHNEANVEPMAVEPTETKMTIPTPAVTFEKSIYTMDQAYQYNGVNVYSIFNTLNQAVMQEALDRMAKNPNPHDMCLINNADLGCVDSIVSSFAVALDNCKIAHLNNLNSMFMIDDSVPAIDFTKSDDGNVRGTFYAVGYKIRSAIIDFMEADKKTQDNMIDSAYLFSSIVVAVNDIGRAIYTDIQLIFNRFIGSISVSQPEVVEKLLKTIDHEFSLMMQDFTYEASSFYLNLSNYFANGALSQNTRLALNDGHGEIE